jgi:tetratricopeptide (TPR) repeat protein
VLSAFALVLILVTGLVFFFFEGKRYFAEVKYNSALRTIDLVKRIDLLTSANRLNPRQELVLQDLAQFSLARANFERFRTDIPEQQRLQNANFFIANAITAARMATDLNPANVTNWQIRGALYREILTWVREEDRSEALDWAKRCYEEASKLEPTNPFIFAEWGRTYLVQASLVPNTPEAVSYLQEAEKYMRRAIELKPDYALAHFQIGLIYEAQGKRKEAISKLEEIKRMFPLPIGYNPMQDVGLAFQLGVLYYRDENYDKAQEEFERAVTLNPAYSNARYFLGLIYDEKGEKEKAIEQFVEIEKYNPENQEVKKILSNLREGKKALEGIVTAPEKILPIEEKPEEK